VLYLDVGIGLFLLEGARFLRLGGEKQTRLDGGSRHSSNWGAASFLIVIFDVGGVCLCELAEKPLSSARNRISYCRIAGK
jgi:hypothetical protein